MPGNPSRRPTTAAQRSDRVRLLEQLFAEQQAVRPDSYLERHGSPHFMRGTEQVYEWYHDRLQRATTVLDWGCRHAPDACMLAAEQDVELVGCDTVEAGHYGVFHVAAGLSYTQLDHEYRLPYDDASFDAVIAAGVLEHVPMEYESLKELSRVTRPGGTLVITYLPNRWSIGEFRARRSVSELHRPGQAHHIRTYTLSGIRTALQSTGFAVVEAGYQTHLDLLPMEPEPSPKRRAVSAIAGRAGLGRLAPCLAVVAQRLTYF